MKLIDVTVRASGSLASAKLRSMLTILAIGVGAFAMTLGISLNEGGGSYAENILTTNINGHSLWVMKKQDEKSTPLHPSHYDGNPAVWFQNFSVKPLNQNDLDKISKIDGVKKVEAVYPIDEAVIANYGNGQEQFRAAVNVARQGAYRVYEAGDGSNMKDDEIILPTGFSEALGYSVADDAINQKVTLTVTSEDGTNAKKSEIFTIRAVIRQSTLSLYVAPMAVLVTNNMARDFYEFITLNTPLQDKVVASNVVVKPDRDLEKVKKNIDSDGYFARTPNDVYSAMYQFVNMFRIVLIIFGIIAVLTAVFGIINTQHISVLERVQEIGLMKAVGMSGGDVGKLFEFEAALMGFVGGAIGMLIAVLCGTVINPFISQALALDKGNELMSFTFMGTVGITLFLTMVSLVAGMIPARRAAQLDPLEALRNDTL